MNTPSPDPIPMAIPASSVPEALPVKPPRTFPIVIIIAASLLTIYGFLMMAGSCWDLTFGAKSLIDVSRQEPKMMELLQKNAPGCVAISIWLSALKLLCGVLIFGSGFLVLFTWQPSRLMAFLGMLGDLAVCLIGKAYILLIFLPAAERAQAELRAQDHGPVGNAFGLFQRAPDIRSFLVTTQMFTLFIALGLWLLLCAPVFVLLGTNLANIAFGNRPFWKVWT